MSSKVDNIDIAVPEASPDSNEAKQAETNKAPSGRRNIYLLLAAFLAVVLTVSIAVPLSLKKDDNDKEQPKPANAEDANAVQVGTFSNDAGASGGHQCFEPIAEDPCNTQESYEECKALEDSGCQAIMSTFSCPPQHRCGDQPAQLPAAELQCLAPSEGDDCTTEESHQECVSLVNDGCQKVLSTFSCPPIHRCGDETAVQLPEETPMQLPEQPEEWSCPAPTEGDECITEESYQFCLQLVEEGCQKVYSTFSCPPLHRCGDEAAEQLPEDPPMVGCTMELTYCADGTPVGRSGPNCHFEQCPDGQCPMDTYLCDDGTELVRDAALGCEFTECPEVPAQLPEGPPPVACTMELSYCADGTPVGRVGPNCEFEACPEAAQLPEGPPPVACTMELSYCADGTPIGRVGPNCEFEACPEDEVSASRTEDEDSPPVLAFCTMELAYCSDGTAVGRQGPDCHFQECPDQSCPVGAYMCDDGTELLRDPSLGCEFPECPAPALVACTYDLGHCADGSVVGRTAPSCHFEMCPGNQCTIDTFTCPNGTELSRDINNDCQFPTCPPAISACTMELKPCPNGGSVGRVGPNCEFEECPSP